MSEFLDAAAQVVGAPAEVGAAFRRGSGRGGRRLG